MSPRSAASAGAGTRSLFVNSLLAAGMATFAPDVVAQVRPALVSDRPDFTESALTVPAGLLQLESGYTLTRGGGSTDHAVGEVLLRLGAWRYTEFRLGLNSIRFVRVSDTEYDAFEGISVGVKQEIFDGAGVRPTLALLLTADLPTGSASLGRDETGSEMVLAAAWDLPAAFALGVNTAVAGLLGGDHGESFSASLGHALGERMGGYLEGYAIRPDGSRRYSTYVDGGVTLALGSDAQLDARVVVQTGGPGKERAFGLGIVKRWSIFSRQGS
jgi:Putative MetA-pathway of phenol degradation